MVAHTCNSSYLGVEDSRKKKLVRLYIKEQAGHNGLCL
jgi:hypothetical protein